MRKIACLMLAVMLSSLVSAKDFEANWLKVQRQFEKAELDRVGAGVNEIAKIQFAEAADLNDKELQERIERAISGPIQWNPVVFPEQSEKPEVSAPEAENIEILGLLQWNSLAFLEQSEKPEVSQSIHYSYYVRVQKGNKADYYVVVIDDRNKINGKEVERVDDRVILSVRSGVETFMSPQEEREHIAKLGERFGQVLGRDELKSYLHVIANKHLLSDVVDFSGSSLTETKSGGYQTELTVHLRNGKKQKYNIFVADVKRWMSDYSKEKKDNCGWGMGYKVWND